MIIYVLASVLVQLLYRVIFLVRSEVTSYLPRHSLGMMMCTGLAEEGHGYTFIQFVMVDNM